jgi:hypothetical protein
MRIPSAGGVQSAGSISVGGATPTISGAGITFPATQSASSDANTLDDYEEGTWTPVMYGTSSDPTFTYVNQIGRYTKIGNLVYVFFHVYWTSKSGGGGAMRMTLPFTSSGASATYTGSYMNDSGGITYGSGYTMLLGQIPPNSSLNYFIVSGSGVSSTTLATGSFASSSFFYGNAIYQVA